MPRSRHRRYRPSIQNLDIPVKANRVLNIILVALLMIIFRTWHLAVIQYDDRLEMAKKPQRKVVLEPAKRATIRDRFNIPLAVNKIQYDAAIVYSELQQIPAIGLENGPDGKKTRVYRRKAYIENLSKILGAELQLDPLWIEDVIYSKAAFQFHVPFVIKRELTEKEYYRLKGLENDWLGIHVMCVPRRYYPQGKVGADLIGYMGAISKKKYDGVLAEIAELKEFLLNIESGENPLIPKGFENAQQVKQHLAELEDKAYKINDWVGKTGVEERFESDLRGYHGKKIYHSDARGNFLKEYPGSTDPLAGTRILLTISSELQNYAEQLLSQNEQIRKVRFTKEDTINLATREPWIKGGAVVVMEPHSGEILAMASYPRYDPNDFIGSSDKEIGKKKRANITRWLESETYIADIWNQRRPLEREFFSKQKGEFYEEALLLSWDQYLSFILPAQNPVRVVLQRIKTIKQAVEFLNIINDLLALCENSQLQPILNFLYRDEGHITSGRTLSAMDKEALQIHLREKHEQFADIKNKLTPFFNQIFSNYEKILLVDLCQLAVNETLYTPELLHAVGEHTLMFHKEASSALVCLSEDLYQKAKQLYHENDFLKWREVNQQTFLKQKRAEEKKAKQYAKPYIDLLDRQESLLFNEFWEQYKWDFITVLLTGKCGAVDEKAAPYIESFHQLGLALEKETFKNQEWLDSYLKLQKALNHLPPSIVQDYLKSLRGYYDLKRPLYGSYRQLRKSTPEAYLEKDLAAGFYPKYGFGYGRSQGYRQAATQGSIFKLVTAYEALKQRLDLFEGKTYTLQDLNPLTIDDKIFRTDKELFLGFTSDGKPIPQHYKGGRMPKSLVSHIGKIDITRALETSSNPYFCLLAGDILRKPEDLAQSAKNFSYGEITGIELPSEISGNVPQDLSVNKTGLYATAIGQHTLVVTPLQTAVMLSSIANGGKVLKPKIVRMMAGKKVEQGSEIRVELFPPVIKRELPMPSAVRRILLDGLQGVSNSLYKSSLPALSRLYEHHSEAIQDLLDVRDQLIGKSSTAEALENIDLDYRSVKNLYNHTWFGSISFDPKNSSDANRFVLRDSFGNPELVIVVYLKYGALGKEAAPLAAQILKKWREIKSRHNKNTHLMRTQ